MADRIASEFSIPEKTLTNLIYSESRWDANATSTTGDYGLVQINLESNPQVTIAEALNPEFSITFAAEAISKNKQDAWTACNCYSFIKTKIKNLPKMADIKPNAKPKIGGVAIFYYGGTIKHLSYIKGIKSGIIELQEANQEPCLVGNRDISVDDKHLVGFWYPPANGG